MNPRRSAVLHVVGTAAPNAENGTKSRPRRVTNEERRPREHLSRDEVLTLCKVARQNRDGGRDAAAIWLAFNMVCGSVNSVICAGPISMAGTPHHGSAAEGFTER